MPHRGRRNADQAVQVALACGATVEAAAQKAGVSPATVYRRLLDPEFCKQLQQAAADMVKRTAGMLSAASMEAVKTLLELLKLNAPPAVRLGAARAVIELGAKLRESADLEKRMQVLEEQSVLNSSNP
jgi:transposase-like protein